MAHIKGKNNKTTEAKLRMSLVRNRVSGWKMRSQLFGSPDFYFPKKKLVVFVDGCFWHACPKCGHLPKTNSRYWSVKFLRNKTRDQLVTKQLKIQGMHIIRFWEHALKNRTGVGAAIEKLSGFVGNK